MKTNRKADPRKNSTHEGAPAFSNLTDVQQLRRSVMSCFLFEKEFYEDGQSIADRIILTAARVDPTELAKIAIEARNVHNLRHVSLLLLTVLAKTGSGRNDGLVRSTIASVISRADEIAEFVALYWRDGKKPLSGQIKKGLAQAFKKFDAYQIAKYNRNNAIKLRDVLFLTHPKPANNEQISTWKKLADKELKSADTWEVSLSAGKDKKETFTRLLKEKKLGYLALLRNIRNMVEADVDEELIESALMTGNSERVLPFRFVAAARACPQAETMIDKALIAKLSTMDNFPGKTIILVDVSYSMKVKLSSKSDLNRMDAAAVLASIFPSAARNKRVFSFSYDTVEVPPRIGMAGVDAVLKSQDYNNTNIGSAVRYVNTLKHDRLIVITDEQSHTAVPEPIAKHAYMINVASAKNGVGYGVWTHIDGFSENVIKFISEFESMT